MESTDRQMVSSTIQLNNIKNEQSDNRNHCNGTNGGDPSDTVYYGVHIPSDIQVQDTDAYSNVYQDKLEALKLVKKYKKARFKAFNFYHEAVEFAVHGSEFPNNNTSTKSNALYGSSTVDNSIVNKENTQPVVGEKPPAFRGPKCQDLVKLRYGIENGNMDMVQTTIWENPRYLISSGDTPAILQEGSRYNALHVGAKAKNRAMCELILNTVSNTSFVKLLYGDDNHQDADERAKMLLDLYLNTPDKGLNETPLHFAVKFGAVEVVELLVSFPQCDKTVKNKFGKSPSMIICDRCENVSTLTKSKISMLLEDTYYVPVLRSEDNCTPPVIGEPFAPPSPPSFPSANILNPRLEIHAYAGPMNKEGADKFRKIWKTPPRSLKLNSSITQNESPASIKFKDLQKGLERVGRDLASKFEVGWSEYWPFLECFTNLASQEGLQQLENYLTTRVNSQQYSCSSSSESILISSSPNIRPVDQNRQDIAALSPISDLCKDLEACTLSNNHTKRTSNMKFSSIGLVSTENSTTQEIVSDTQLFKPDLNPFLCVEKSCQVFAHRISNDILHLLENEFNNTTVMLESQVKQLQLLMASFMDDSRFISVDFHLVHYRLGYLISRKLRDVLILEDEYNFMRKTLEQWLDSCGKQFDCFSSDDESCSYRQTIPQKKSTSKNKQVMCLLECILSTLTAVDTHLSNTNNITNEEQCMQAWGEAKPCACVWQTPLIRKNTLGKKGNSFKYSSRALASSFRNDHENICQQLIFSDDKSVPINANHCDNNILINKSTSEELYQSLEDNSGTDDEFYTPPSSPPLMEYNSSDEDENVFEDSIMPDFDVFIEGNVPTKTDYAVFHAVKCAGDRLNPHDYPNVYRWHHAVSLYPQREQESWSMPSYGRCILGSPCTSTPTRGTNHYSPNFYSPPSSWLRITGPNSPRNSLKTFRRNSISLSSWK